MGRARRSAGSGGLLSLIWTMALFAAALGVWLIWEIHRPGPLAAAVGFDVRRGAAISQIAATLEEQGAIRSSLIFRVAAELYATGNSLKAGQYEAETGESLRSLLEKLEQGRMKMYALTFPEGVTSEMAMEIIAASPVLTGPTPPTPPEGSLLPETYLVSSDTPREEVVTRMRNAQSELLARLWPDRAERLPLRTPEEAVILASIVEKETGVAEERRRVAALFVNRLRRGMRLESDPTIIYALTKGRPLGRGIRQSELDAATPYNTYKIDGLTPTPIANPGKASLEAVLRPAETDELFFVADGTGGHVFSRTYEEHARHVVRYREIERQRAAGTP